MPVLKKITSNNLATASRVTHPCHPEVEVCVIKASLQIGLLPHFHTFHHFLTVLGDIFS